MFILQEWFGNEILGSGETYDEVFNLIKESYEEDDCGKTFEEYQKGFVINEI